MSLAFSLLYEKPEEALALKSSSAESVEIGIVGEEETLISGASSNSSWPGEIVSSEISQVQPQREGIITEWRANIGQTVKVGQILGKISAPPATPELIQMLAEQRESLSRAQAQIATTEQYVVKEKERLVALKAALDGEASSGDSTFQSLARLREMAETEKKALRNFVEQSLNSHVTTMSSAATWRSFKVGMMNKDYGTLDQSLQHVYETALASFVEELKNSPDVGIESARSYYALAVRVANATPSSDMAAEFKTMTREDQTELSTMVTAYQKAVAEIADKETEYRIMISEKSAMLERERTMATADANASESAYATVAGQITGSIYITAQKSGVVSAIYKKVGDLVSPEMAIAVIAGSGNKSVTIRMRIPSNIQKPKVGDELSVVRPGFPTDIRKATLIGIGSSLDASGAYMADAVTAGTTDWPVNASVRVFGAKENQSVTIPTSSILWNEDGTPFVWTVSAAERVFSTKITIGRTIGDFTEVYSGLSLGDRYLKTTPSDGDIAENMFLDELLKRQQVPVEHVSEPIGHEGHNMEGM
jgi:multidrug efflux pump subunit AcrA (membrane-fusion protein)